MKIVQVEIDTHRMSPEPRFIAGMAHIHVPISQIACYGRDCDEDAFMILASGHLVRLSDEEFERIDEALGDD